MGQSLWFIYLHIVYMSSIGKSSALQESLLLPFCQRARYPTCHIHDCPAPLNPARPLKNPTSPPRHDDCFLPSQSCHPPMLELYYQEAGTGRELLMEGYPMTDVDTLIRRIDQEL